MIEARPEQFSLLDEGTICFQQNPTNPLPGVAVGAVKKGEGPMTPLLEPIQNQYTAGLDSVALREKLNAWWDFYCGQHVACLHGLKEIADLPDPVKTISSAVYAGLGVVPRKNVETAIAALDPDMRATLRAKRIRLGPVLIFQPDLNKPAAIRLRALLWRVYHGKTLPAPLPFEGIVSMPYNPDLADKDYYQAIGYPVFGPRALRIDMLDRVINLIYESVKEGKFQAQHQMAEWLGCPIEDLYKTLEDLGHKKAFDPAEVKESVEDEKEEEKSSDNKDINQEPASKNAEPVKRGGEKPELATFYLKRGKAYTAQQHKKAAGSRASPQNKKKSEKKTQKNKRPRQPKTMSFGPETRPENSPFAILKQLKVGNDEN